MNKLRSKIVNVDEVRLPGNWVLRLARGLNCPACHRPAAIYQTQRINCGARIDCPGCGAELITFKPSKTKPTATAIAAAAIPHEEKADQ